MKLSLVSFLGSIVPIHRSMIFLALLSTFLFGCGAIRADRKYLKPDGDYEDSGFTHTIRVKKIQGNGSTHIGPLDYPSLPNKLIDHPQSEFEGGKLYVAFSRGNALTSQEEVIKRALSAINLMGLQLSTKYAALFNGMTHTLTVHRTDYTDHFYSYGCHVLFFNEDQTYFKLSNLFEKLQVIEMNEHFDDDSK